MKPPNKLRLFAALIAAAAFSFWTREGWRRIKNAFLIWFRLLSKGEHWAGKELFEQRMSACRACPFFWSPLRTCGSPLKPSLAGAGCWCNVEDGKARIQEADCWLDASGIASPYSWNAKIPLDPTGDKA